MDASVSVAKPAGLRDRDDILSLGHLHQRHVRPMPDDTSLLFSDATPRPQVSRATALA
ncbi:hypothetical protein NXC14_PC00021 (plasmid) [Rhizobium sp. NXC14]|nr:hypothetical protein NXC14_PC00021 [Rhizobium sp. NXC14]